jgi:signal transduction histidine kinase/DNA-binding NarL/FixJ family response regulator
MNSRFYKSTLKPVIGIFILSLIAVVFLTVSALNEAVEGEIKQSEAFVEFVTKDIEAHLDEIAKDFYIVHRKLPIERVLFDLQMNALENPLFREIIEDEFAGNKKIAGAVLIKDNNVQLMHYFDDNTVSELEYVYSEENWQQGKYFSYRYHLVIVDTNRFILLEVPASEEYLGYELGILINPDDIMSKHFLGHDYDIHLLAYNGAELRLDENHDVVNELQNRFGPDIFNDKGNFDRTKSEIQISDFNYYNGIVIVSDSYLGLTVVVTKPYNKFDFINLQAGLTTRIVIFGVLMVAVIATIIYSSQKTKKWINTDKQFLNDIVEMDKIQIAELKKESKFYKDYFLDSKLPILFIDKESFRLVNVNRAAVMYYDYTEDEMTDMYLSDVCHWNLAEMNDVLSIEHHKRNGKKEVRAVRLQDGVFNDTELLIMMVMIDQDLKIDQDKLRMEMFHEIRSPLQGAVGAIEMIEKASDNYGEYTSIIKRSLNNVLMMTNNVLANGKLSHQQSKVLNSEFDLVQLVDEVISTTVYQDKHYNLIAGQVQENIEDVLTPLNDYMLNSDGIKLRQILLNLMSNASKYTVDGMVNINVDVSRQDNEDILVFRVTDTGNGLNKEEIDHIFDEYTTFTQDSKITSTGIGLSITKKYVEMLGSELHISSEKSVGTTFSFSLTVQSTKDQVVNIENRRSVLIVDDDEISCDYLKHLIEKELNCYVKTLTNETALLGELNHNHYDCMIIDQNLNHYNGIDLIKLIKSSINKRIVEIPIVMITASSSISALEESASLFNAIVQKPFENDKVLSVLKTIFNSEEKCNHDICKLINTDILDKAVLCETYESVGNEIFRELISKFKTNSTEEIELIVEKVNGGDFIKVSSMLHRLKGSMSYFAPVKCQKLIVILESLAVNESIAFMDTYRDFADAHKELINELDMISKNI